MTDEAIKKGSESTRRSFLKASTALAGAALAGVPGLADAQSPPTVSYTHLTLPTIYSV